MTKEIKTGPVGEEIGRKLTAKDVGWDSTRILEAVLSDKENDVFLYRAIGMATATKRYESDISEGFGLVGTFEVTNEKGEVSSGSVLYLPGYVQDMIVAGLHSAGEGAAVRIGLDVFARFESSAATKYIYVARQLLQTDTSALDAIKAQISDMPMPALPAPKG